MSFVLLETLQPGAEDRLTLWTDAPESILQTTEPEQVVPLLQELERATAAGYWAIGFLCYEAGSAFLPHLPAPHPVKLPLAWFALVRKPQRLSPGELPPDFANGNHAEVQSLRLNMDRGAYADAIETIRGYIEKGDTYQVNFTMRYRGKFEGSTRALYTQLRRKQSVPYAGYIETDEWTLLSLSPELFFRMPGRDIWMRPMKGTAPRGRTRAEDELHASHLRESAKERSENLMIVDMLRSDLGKICETGSIEVTSPLQVERYETLLQMTSSLRGRLREETGMAELFRATFPSGSVTGAPKVRTMQIIHELEKESRGIYTGSIGFASSEGSIFNVAIRTVVVDHRTGAIEMGVGSGILYEADPNREYEECELKGRFLTEAQEEFQLLETILWRPEDRYCRLSLHLDRLMESADYFLFSLDRQAIESALTDHEIRLRESGMPQRVRLLVDRNGSWTIAAQPVEPMKMARVCLAEAQTDSSDRFLFHKTTHRSLYDTELQKTRERGFFDVLFRNEKNEITEGAISNVFIRKDGVYYTPPVSCGLLPGTYRRFLIETRPFPIEERVLYLDDLLQGDEIYLCNAIRGLVRAQIIR